MGDHLEIQITCGSVDEADRIADALVERRFAACVQQLPIRSTYRWDGAVQHDDEILLLVKTRSDRFDDVAATVRELHSYDVPAVTAVPIARGSADYLAWIHAETSDPEFQFVPGTE
jgi:periplasmic divalent cation tolerance protein